MIDSQNGIITILCEKMLFTHAKPGIKAKSLECYLLLFEASEVFDESLETMQGLLKHKNVKVSIFKLNQHLSNIQKIIDEIRNRNKHFELIVYFDQPLLKSYTI